MVLKMEGRCRGGAKLASGNGAGVCDVGAHGVREGRMGVLVEGRGGLRREGTGGE